MDNQETKPERKKPGPKPRKPMGDVSTAKRRSMHKHKQMDDAVYHAKHGKENKLLWILDSGGSLDRWLDVGAEVVTRISKSAHSDFDEFRGRKENPYVRVVGGVIDGNTVYQYLLMIKHEIYNEVKIEPERRRQQEIRDAMGLGGGEGMAMEARAVNTAGVETYAPYNAEGTRGFNQIKQ